MSTITPPSLGDLPTTPANEWADSTTSAINNPSLMERQDSTPRIPGAYRRTESDFEPLDTTAVINNAKQYIPQIPQTVTAYFGKGPKPVDAPANDDEVYGTTVTVPSREFSDPVSNRDSLITEPESVANLSTKAVAGSSVGSPITESNASAVSTPVGDAKPIYDSASTLENREFVESPVPMSFRSESAQSATAEPALPAVPVAVNPTPPDAVSSTVPEIGHSPLPQTPPKLSLQSSPNGSKFLENHPEPSSTGSGDSGKNSHGSNNSSSPSKSRFLDKIKGEVKVISGKLGKNEEKIEEGKRLLGKA